MAARRIPLERPPSKAEEATLLRDQEAVRLKIGAHLKRLREEAGLSLRQMGMRANVSPTYLSEAERGQRNVTVDFLIRMGRFFEINPADFLSDD